MIATVDPDFRHITLKFETQLEKDQIHITFKKKIRNWKFRTKNKAWKGDVLFIKTNNKIPLGLWTELGKMCKQFDFQLKVSGFDKILDNEITKQEVEDFCLKLFSSHSKGITPRPYQINAVYQALRYRFCLLDLSQSAGKTAIEFMILMFLFYTKRIKKLLIVCPDTDLVLQTHDEFLEHADKRFNMKVCVVHGGSRIMDISDARIVIGNFQSLSNRDEEFFKDVDCVFVDEAHRGGNASIKYIFDSCRNVKYRIGLSGSIIDDKSADFFDLLAYFGPIVAKVTKKELMDADYATSIEIKIFKLNYLSEKLRKELAMLKFRSDVDGEQVFRYEQKLVRASTIRLIWICELISKLNGNALIFFLDKKTGYGKRIVDQLRRMTSHKEIYYIDGDVKNDLRQVYKNKMEEGSNKVLVASYDTYSTGKSIKNIRYLFGAESRKSEVIISQVLGRGMRLHDDKEKFVWIDVIDDFSLDIENYENKSHMMRHGTERMKYYEKEGFDYEITDVDLMNKATDNDIQL